jgi:HEAT repeats
MRRARISDSMNESNITALCADLDGEDKPTIRAAVEALITLAANSPSVREKLNRRLAETGHRNYWPVAYILGHLPQPSRAVISALLGGLDHREADIRWAIGLLLVRLAKTEPSLIEPLIDLSVSGTAHQKRMALYCIRDLALADASSLMALFGALKDADPGVRVAAAICLKSRSDLDRDAKALLLDVYLKDPAMKVRNAAAIALAYLGEPSAEFLSALHEAANCDNDQVRKTALAALDLLRKKRSASAERKPR